MSRRVLAGCAVVLAACVAALANHPPNAPTIIEPSFDGEVINSQDLHMETAPFSDPDPGDTLFCSDWEIWTVGPPSELIWTAYCRTGTLAVHIHLGDGTFQGSHAGRTSLLPTTNYFVRTRQRDSSNDPLTEWSPYSVRYFSTAPLSTVFPLELQDIVVSPLPAIADTTGTPFILPGGTSPSSITLDGPTGAQLLVLRGVDGSSNQVINPPPLTDHADLRVTIASGGANLFMPDANLTFTDDHGVDHTVYLAGVNLQPNQSIVYWVSTNGGTYVGSASQTQPDFSTLARGAPVPWQINEPGFKMEVFATGFQLPVDIAFIRNPGFHPTDPLFYVTELYGTIKVVRRNGTVGVYASNLLNYDPGGAFPGSGEQGLTGIAVEPISKDIYASMLYDSGNANHDTYPKVVRFHSTDGGQTAATQTTVLNMVGEVQGPSHQISNLSFAYGGRLFVHVGDGNIITTAEDMNSFQGKILRVNLDGTAPSDNPFYDAAHPASARSYIYCYGLRNPFGGAWRDVDGAHYEVEVGPTLDRFAKIVAGRDYHWAGSDADMTNFAIYNWNDAVPVNLAFIQASTGNGSAFPASKQGHAFVTESGSTYASGFGKLISEWVLDSAGNLAQGPIDFADYSGSGKATCIGLASGPDGLYFTDLYKDSGNLATDVGANVLRIRWVGIADYSASVRVGFPPLAVQFTDASDVPTPSAWLWSFGDGSSSNQQNPLHTYASEGAYDVRLSVTGAGGVAAVQRTAYITVSQTPAIAVIGGNAIPSGPDHALADHLRSFGFNVEEYDDLPTNRPSASDMSSDFHAAVVLASANAANIGGEFRSASVPLMFTQSSLLTLADEPLTSSGASVSGITRVTITNNSHTITDGLSLADLTVFQPGAAMTVGRGTLSPGATVLATRFGASADYALVAADRGAILAGGYTAPSRRVFMFLGNGSYTNATASAIDLFDRSLCWAMNGNTMVATQPVATAVNEGSSTQLSVAIGGAGPFTYQWRRAGANLVNIGHFSGTTMQTLTISPASVADMGPYDCVISGPCGSVTTQSAMLTVHGCYANCDGSTAPPIINIADYTCFLQKFMAGDPYANCDGSSTPPTLTILDFLCFQARVAAGCP